MLLILAPASAQYGYGSSGAIHSNFDPIAYFRPIANNGGPGFPSFGFDPFNPFIYGSVWNPLSFLGPRNPGTVSSPVNNSNESKSDEKNSSLLQF